MDNQRLEAVSVRVAPTNASSFEINEINPDYINSLKSRILTEVKAPSEAKLKFIREKANLDQIPRTSKTST